MTPDSWDEKPDIFKVDARVNQPYKYYYNREERLSLKNGNRKETQKHKRLKSIASWLLIMLAISIGMLVFFLLYKIMN